MPDLSLDERVALLEQIVRQILHDLGLRTHEVEAPPKKAEKRAR